MIMHTDEQTRLFKASLGSTVIHHIVRGEVGGQARHAQSRMNESRPVLPADKNVALVESVPVARILASSTEGSFRGHSRKQLFSAFPSQTQVSDAGKFSRQSTNDISIVILRKEAKPTKQTCHASP
jgi:hypothetical protein